MLYYGDRSRTVAPRDELAAIAARLARARALTGEAREEVLLAALVECGELAQGLADHAFDAVGHDGEDPATAAGLALTVEIARAWLSAGVLSKEGPWPDPRHAIAVPLPAVIRVRVPEGYAHYALYPALYAEAARRVRATRDQWFVVGLRSIGTSLAAVVAVACGAREVVTVRPVGHPHARELRIGGALERRLRHAIEQGASFAVVDEGPGLSGSSFASVATWLAAAGAQPRRIVFLPGHLGPLGPAAPEARRAWWDGAERHAIPFEEVVLPRLEGSLSRTLGTAAVQDLGGGRWRAVLGEDAGAVPPVFAMQERRKYLAVGPGGSLLVRYAGVGPYSERALERARALADAGWAPPARMVFPGFLGTDVAPRASGPREALPSRPELLAYLADRTRLFPASGDDGASQEQLLEMLRVNAIEALGRDADRRIDRFVAGVRQAASLPRVGVDGKLEWWEWTRSREGRPWKLDATDHAWGHDLVGCQPGTWDVAGARIELGLPRSAALELARRVVPGATAEVLAFHEAAYLAHRIGRWTFALAQETDPAERARIEHTLARYRERLRRRL